MTLAEAQRQSQAALEYRRTARERYTTDEELAECDEAVDRARADVEVAWLAHNMNRDPAAPQP
jgi:hypothetical protein